MLVDKSLFLFGYRQSISYSTGTRACVSLLEVAQLLVKAGAFVRESSSLSREQEGRRLSTLFRSEDIFSIGLRSFAFSQRYFQTFALQNKQFI